MWNRWMWYVRKYVNVWLKFNPQAWNTYARTIGRIWTPIDGTMNCLFSHFHTFISKHIFCFSQLKCGRTLKMVQIKHSCRTDILRRFSRIYDQLLIKHLQNEGEHFSIFFKISLKFARKQLRFTKCVAVFIVSWE